jgi:hypothetical protein
VTKFVYKLDNGAETDVPGDETATSVTITGLDPGSQHTVIIAAVNDYGIGVFTSEVTQYTAPAAPTDVTIADNTEPTKFDISWKKTATADSYVILWSDGTNFNEETTYIAEVTDCSLPDDMCKSTFLKSTFITETEISDGTTVQVKVRALHSTNSGSVGTDSGQTSETYLIAKKPELTGATVAYDGTDVKISWTADRTIENLAYTVYVVKGATVNAATCTQGALSSASTECTVTMTEIRATYNQVEDLGTVITLGVEGTNNFGTATRVDSSYAQVVVKSSPTE